MFEKATRLKLRFAHKGGCTVEDLWDLNVHQLDDIYKGLKRLAKTLDEDSLLGAKSKTGDVTGLKVDIVKHVVDVKLAEQEQRENALQKARLKQKLLGVIESKQDEQLKSLSLEELQKMAAGL